MFDSSKLPVFTMVLSFLVLVIVILNALLTDNSRVAQSSSTGTRVTSTLQFLIVVSRHGNRGPLFNFPTYPYKDKAFWPFGDGQLTKHGRIQMYKLGMKIRSLYNGFLDENYSPEIIKSLSTLVDRTMMSAQQFLAGLFPPKGYQIWNEQLAWQPIPVYPNHLDHTPDYDLCPRYVAEINKALARYKKEMEENNIATLEPTISFTGQSFTAQTLPEYIFSIQDSLYCADNEGLLLPTWSQSVYPEPISSLRINYLKQYVLGSDTITRLYQGTLFQDMINSMQTKMNETLNTSIKIKYYSGHDTTILGLQAILGQLNSEIKLINTASALILELHKDIQPHNYYIQTLFIDGGKSDLEPKLVEIPKCGNKCNFDILKSITEKFYNITNYKEECIADV